MEGIGRGVARGWRIVRTSFGFALLGAMSLLLAFVVLPLLRLWPEAGEQRELRAQAATHWFARAYLRALRILRVLRIEYLGLEKLNEPGSLVVANHPTLLDVLVLLAAMPQADCVVKESYYTNPFLGGAAKGAGYIPSRDGPGIVAECVTRLRRGRSVVIFPEGTRSPPHELGPFARGAAHISLRAGCDPVPVTIRCDPVTLYKGQTWWDVPERCFTLTAAVAAPLLVKEAVLEPMSRPRDARVLTAALREHFERSLSVVR